jgi:signal transduction histidine kinase
VIAQELGLRVAGALDNARLYHEAQEAVREREALLSVASHELKNPLTSLLGYTHLLERRVVAGAILGDRELKHIHMIREQGSRLSKMLDLLLDMARLDSGQLVLQTAVVDMGGVIERILTEIDATLSIHTILFYEPDAPAILEGDELRLEQVVRNLLSNAIKYSPDGGEITVRLETAAERVVLSIQDRGIGIPAEALPRIFQRFSRVGGTTISGLGVGLYVVREIIALHSGAVEVVSEEGVGSTFTVTLPACPDGGS